jgi:hypothetical protein
MLLNAYAILLGLGVYLNRHDRRMLALTFVIGVSVFLPVPRQTAFAFYTFCIIAELLVALIAWRLNTRATELVIGICAVLVLAHVMGYILNGHPSLSSYRVIVPLLESAQLLTCVCMSPSLYARLQNRQT